MTGTHKAGDKVWMLNNFNEPTKALIGIHSHGDVYLCFDDGTHREKLSSDKLFASRAGLIESQVKRWTKMLAKEIALCQHEPETFMQELGNESFKCKKCGEFY